MSTSDMKKAREWAAEIAESRQTNIRPDAFADARMIQSLPDQWVDAGEVREVISKVLASTLHGTVGRQVAEDYAALIGELIPTPPLPTLADMTPEEREACQWMQADVSLQGETLRVAITRTVERYSSVEIIDPNGFQVSYDHELVTPLPDLPRLEWPGSHADTITAESVEDVQAGRVADFEPALLRPKDVPAGEPWIVESHGFRWVGNREAEGNGPCMWALARLDSKIVDLVFDEHVTLVSRLVPEVEP